MAEESDWRPSTQRSFSRRWKPVNFMPSSTTSSRPSIIGSRSPNDSATGSIRSHGPRATGKAFLASSTLPALTRSTNSVVRTSSSSDWADTKARYWVTAAAIAASGAWLAAVPVTVKSARMPLPFMPGLHAVWYVPGVDTSTWKVRVRPGVMFSTSPMIWSPSP